MERATSHVSERIL